ncbi:MAG: diguanylate cyclase [Clostridia bacterium]|nr:diguanylate cyclase [Clostridia bacterium]
MLGESTFVKYTFNGAERQAAWLPLNNGMRLNVSVPVSETEGNWKGMLWNVLIVAAELLIAATVFVMLYTKRITKPLEQLTAAADQADRGNYDFNLNYDKDDELGRLTSTFRRLAGHMKTHISDLNKRAYVDALTSVRNKGAYSTYIEDLQTKLDASNGHMAFAIGVFDCDDLKLINDKFGHEKGDIYLKTSSRIICKVFQHSPVFRIGGDEFSVILQNDDFRNRDSLTEAFCRSMEDTCASSDDPWDQARISYGIAVYDPYSDNSVADVARRADKIM